MEFLNRKENVEVVAGGKITPVLEGLVDIADPDAFFKATSAESSAIEESVYPITNDEPSALNQERGYGSTYPKKYT